MPKRILIIGILFCLIGLYSCWGLVLDIISLFTQPSVTLSLNFGVPFLPIGIGLLLGRPWAQRWARILIIILYIFCFIALIIFFVAPQPDTVYFFKRDLTGVSTLPYVILVVAVTISMLVLTHWLLYTEKAKNYFNRLKY